MNFYDEIKKMQEQTITIRMQVTDECSQQLREMARAFRLEDALKKSLAQHWTRVLCGFDPRLN